MKNFVEHLSTYAEYHRDQRNIWTHFIGVPMIVFAVIVLLSRPAFEVASLTLTPAMIGFVFSMMFYLRLNLAFGLIMAVLMGAGLYAANSIAAMSTVIWLSAGAGLFVVGWVIQFVGHHYEGKKPAFVDDLVGLMIGPLFVTAEILFALGMFKSLEKKIEERAGKIRPYQSDAVTAQK
jgi:uncharacterized membrane protein YGL010W